MNEHERSQLEAAEKSGFFDRAEHQRLADAVSRYLEVVAPDAVGDMPTILEGLRAKCLRESGGAKEAKE